jgi:hypothetical protein
VVIARRISERRRSVSACNVDAVVALKSSWSAAPFGDCVRRSEPTRRRSTALVDCLVQQRRTDHHTSVTTMGLLPTVLTINCTSIAKPHALEQLKADIQGFNIEIIAICETWLKPKQDSKLFSIVDYRLYRFDRVGGGVCVYLHITLASNITTLHELEMLIHCLN